MLNHRVNIVLVNHRLYVYGSRDGLNWSGSVWYSFKLSYICILYEVPLNWSGTVQSPFKLPYICIKSFQTALYLY